MKKYFNLKDKSGASLVIALIYVSAFLLVIAGLTEAVLKTTQAIRNSETSAKAFYLAEGAMEKARLWIKENGVGENAVSGDFSADDREEYLEELFEEAAMAGIGDCASDSDPVREGVQPCIGFEVLGRGSGAAAQVRLNSADYYSVPMKGTGNAGENCAGRAVDSLSNADDPCNWNRLNFGQSVEIPLTYDGGETIFSGQFKLRIRTPCGSFDDSRELSECSENIDLYPLTSASDYRNTSADPVLVQWLISGETAGRESVTLIANDRLARTDELRHENSTTGNANTELSGGRINEAKRDGDDLNYYAVLEQNYSSKNISAISPGEISSFLATINNPVLRLSLVTHPKKNQKSDGTLYSPSPALINDASFDLPYLEYQLLTDGGHPVPDSKSRIRAWMRIGDFREEIIKDVERPASLSGFAMENF